MCTIFGRIGFRGYTKDDLVDFTGAITLSPSNIVDGVMNYEKCTYISWEKYDESPEIQVHNHDILLVKTGSSFGKCAYVESLPKEATINPQFVVLKNIGCNHKFLTYCLQSNYARTKYEEFVLGTAIPTFTQVALGAMLIPMPPLNEQERIVADIEKLLILVDLLDESKQDVEIMISTLRSKILGLAISGKLVPQNPNDEPAIDALRRINSSFQPCDNPHYQQLPKGWTLATLKDIGKWQSGATPSKTNKTYYNNATIPWLNTGDLNDGEITSIPKSISEIALHETSVKLNPAGSILIAMYGATIGKLGILTFPATTNQACCACVNCVINKQFLFYFLLSHREEFIQMGGGGAQPNISKEKIESTIIPIPPIAEQERIVKAIHITLAKIDTIAANL
jgi:type I restriction enzyme S subunit